MGQNDEIVMELEEENMITNKENLGNMLNRKNVSEVGAESVRLSQ